MERRTALALSISGAATFLVGGMTFASLGGADILGFAAQDSGATPVIVAGAQLVDGATIINGAAILMAVTTTAVPVVAGEIPGTQPAAPTDVGTAPGTPAPTSPRTSGPTTPSSATDPAPGAPQPAAVTPTPTQGTTAATPPPGTSPTTIAATTPPTTTAKTTPTTTPRTTQPTTTTPPTTAGPTTTVRPAGVPASWPADKPIPPKPPGCVNGQLEDNGVWNCQH